MQGISVSQLFEDLRRVEVMDSQQTGGWSFAAIADLALDELEELGSCLVIVNTKKAAQAIYQECTGQTDAVIFHLSTSMCPAHRKTALGEIRRLLEEKQPVLCVSTQLIEVNSSVRSPIARPFALSANVYQR